MAIKEIRWSVEKDQLLRSDPTRGGIGLVECAVAIEEGRILDDLPNPMRDYAYVVPYVTDGRNHIFENHVS
jgi:hypothetical protein